MKKLIYIIIIILSGKNIYSQDAVWSLSEVSMDARTHYDLQSNGSCHMLEVDPTISLKMHAVFTVATDQNPWVTRNARYFYTNDGGTSWSYLGTVSATRSGFPSLTLLSDGRAAVSLHSSDGGGMVRSQIYVEVAPGAGSWTRHDPGGGNSPPLWPVCEGVSNNRILFCASSDSIFRNILNLPSTFTGYQSIDQGWGYACAVADNVRWGIAYITNSNGVRFIETLDGGVTWSSPVTVWTRNQADSLGALRGIDCGYKGNIPNVVFEICNVDPVGATFKPKSPSKIYFWSPIINGGNPVMFDSAGGLTGSNPTNDVFTSVCRPVIGYVNNGNVLIIAYSKARTDTSALGNNYFDVFIKCSLTSGASWSSGNRVTNNFGPLVDCRYVSISNNNNNSVNLIFQMDSIAGSNVNGSPASTAHLMYARGTNNFCAPFGIINTGNEIPGVFYLKQNYPNPFNPVTQIEFGLPKGSFVSITIFNSIGQQVEMIVSQNLPAGTYKADWDAGNYPSGVYFYVLKAGEYFESKKMILIK